MKEMPERGIWWYLLSALLGAAATIAIGKPFDAYQEAREKRANFCLFSHDIGAVREQARRFLQSPNDYVYRPLSMSAFNGLEVGAIEVSSSDRLQLTELSAQWHDSQFDLVNAGAINFEEVELRVQDVFEKSKRLEALLVERCS